MERNSWIGIQHIKHMDSLCLMPFHLIHSSYYYKLASTQQPPVLKKFSTQIEPQPVTRQTFPQTATFFLKGQALLKG